jgi:hypothetical protein
MAAIMTTDTPRVIAHGDSGDTESDERDRRELLIVGCAVPVFQLKRLCGSFPPPPRIETLMRRDERSNSPYRTFVVGLDFSQRSDRTQ